MLRSRRSPGGARGPRVLAWGSLAVLLAAVAVTLVAGPVQGLLVTAGSLVLAALSAWSLLHSRG